MTLTYVQYIILSNRDLFCLALVPDYMKSGISKASDCVVIAGDCVE